MFEVEAKINLSEAIKVLKEALKDDDYFYSWQANIAVDFQDAYERAESKDNIHKISNDAALNFLRRFMQ